MKLPKFVVQSHSSQSCTAQQVQGDLFVIVRNHRQACIRKYLRKVRKEKQKQKKRQEEKWVEQEEKNRNDILNHNMLAEEDLWQVLIEDEKCEQNSETQQTGAQKVSKMEQVIELVQQLPVWPKRSLFSNQFCEFSFVA